VRATLEMAACIAIDDDDDEVHSVTLHSVSPSPCPRTMEPTRGAISRIHPGSLNRDFAPHLEVRNVMQLNNPQGGRSYALTVTDGDFVVNCLVLPGSGLAPQIERYEVIVTTLLCFTDYRLEAQGHGSSFLPQARVMGMVPEHLRVPKERLQQWGVRLPQPAVTQPDPDGVAFAPPIVASSIGGPAPPSCETTPARAEHTPVPVAMQPCSSMQRGVGTAANQTSRANEEP